MSSKSKMTLYRILSLSHFTVNVKSEVAMRKDMTGLDRRAVGVRVLTAIDVDIRRLDKSTSRKSHTKSPS